MTAAAIPLHRLLPPPLQAPTRLVTRLLASLDTPATPATPRQHIPPPHTDIRSSPTGLPRLPPTGLPPLPRPVHTELRRCGQPTPLTALRRPLELTDSRSLRTEARRSERRAGGGQDGRGPRLSFSLPAATLLSRPIVVALGRREAESATQDGCVQLLVCIVKIVSKKHLPVTCGRCFSPSSKHSNQTFRHEAA